MQTFSKAVWIILYEIVIRFEIEKKKKLLKVLLKRLFDGLLFN